jgi:hypothetical protein
LLTCTTRRREELRFAKKQQWAVATASVTLLAAIFALQHSLTDGLKCVERIAFSIAIVLIAIFGTWFLIKLQQHLRDTRLQLDPNDRNPATRGADILGVLIGVVILSSICVLYFVALR